MIIKLQKNGTYRINDKIPILSILKELEILSEFFTITEVKLKRRYKKKLDNK